MERENFYYFKRKPIKLKSKYERWRGVAELLPVCDRQATFSKREVKSRMDDILPYPGEAERRSHCQTFWYIQKDFS